MHEMAKLYQVGTPQTRLSTSNFNRRIMTEGAQDSLDQLRQQSID